MLIAVVGSMGSGKGTVGDCLVDQEGFRKYAFADGVKDATASIFGWPRHLLEGDTKESRTFRETVDPFWSEKFGFDVTPRWALQKVGTEGGRDALHPDLWIHRCIRDISIADNESAFGIDAVITDARFPNEIDAVLDVPGAEVWFVSKTADICFTPGATEWAYEWCKGLKEHALREGKIVGISAEDVAFGTEKTGLHRSEWDWFRHPGIAQIGTPKQSNRIKHIINDGTIEDLYRKVAGARLESK